MGGSEVIDWKVAPKCSSIRARRVAMGWFGCRKSARGTSERIDGGTFVKLSRG